jgi:small conductance mechanosensitive channel
MANLFRKRNKSEDLNAGRNPRLDRMFETRSDAWEAAGLSFPDPEKDKPLKRAQQRAIVLLPLLIAVLEVWSHRVSLFGTSKHCGHLKTVPCAKALTSATSTWIEVGTVIALVILGWAFSRDLGRAAAPTFFKRMDPATAGTVAFLIRLASSVILLVVALNIVGFHSSTIAAGGAFTAVIFGLAAQQTLGNVIAGMVLLSARPFRVGERVRLQAGAVGGYIEGVVASLGLLYTTLVRGKDRILIPNNVVLAAVVVPLIEPEPVDVKVRLSAGVRPGHIQAMLDDAISTPTRSKPRVLLEEIDGDRVVVRVQATPERASDGAQLADEIIGALSNVTGDHALVDDE